MNFERRSFITDAFTKSTDKAKRLNVAHGVPEKVRKEGDKLFRSPAKPTSTVFVRTKKTDK